jgi:hypothetical protein
MSQYDEDVELGDCFKVAANLAVPVLGMLSEELSDLSDITLVHGIVSGQGHLEGFRYTHAWIEGISPEGIPMVVDASDGRRVVIPQALYYLIGQIQPDECERYTPEAAQDRMLEFAHYGPWDGAPEAHIDPTPEEIERYGCNKHAVA